MIVLYIYIGTIVYSIVTHTTVSYLAKKYVENEGYEFVKKKMSFGNWIAARTLFLVCCSLPIINVITATRTIKNGPKWLADQIIPIYLKNKVIKKKILTNEDVDTKNMKTCDIKDITNDEEISKTNTNVEKVILNEHGFKVTVTDVYTGPIEDKGPTRGRSRFNSL